MLEFAKYPFVAHIFFFLKQNIHRGLVYKFSHRIAAWRAWRTSKTNVLSALLWTGIRRGTTCLIKLWIVCVSSPSSLWSPRGRKSRRREAARKERICSSRSRAPQPERELYVPHVDACMWPLSLIQPITFLCAWHKLLTGAAHFFCCAHTFASACGFCRGEINAAATICSKQLSACKAVASLSQHPVILQRFAPLQAGTEEVSQSYHPAQCMPFGLILNVLLWRRSSRHCGHIHFHLFYFIEAHQGILSCRVNILMLLCWSNLAELVSLMGFSYVFLLDQCRNTYHRWFPWKCTLPFQVISTGTKSMKNLQGFHLNDCCTTTVFLDYLPFQIST